MTSVFQTSVSGLNDAITRVANAASNIVNASSISALPKNSADYTGYVPKDVITISNSVGDHNLGVHSVSVPREPAYNVVSDSNSPLANDQGLVATPNVDLTAEIVTQQIATVSYAANATVIAIEARTQKSLLDVLR